MDRRVFGDVENDAEEPARDFPAGDSDDQNSKIAGNEDN
jgi:hypothetical protein